MVNFYNSKNVGSNFDPDFEVNAKDRFRSAFASLFGNLKSTVLMMFMMLAIGQLSWAQSTANYAFTTNTTSSLVLDANGNAIDMSSGTTQLVGADLDNSSSSVTNMGFNFNMYGSSYTQFSASSNGVLQLGSSAVGTATYVLSGGSTTTPRIGAFAADLRTGSNGKVHYKVVGTAPNRCLVVEFNNMSLTYVGSPGSNDGTYQVRLYETTGVIEYVYGSMYKNASTIGSAAIYSGFSVGTVVNTTASITTSTNTVSNGATFNTNTYTNSANIPNLHSTTDGSRRMYRFTPYYVTPADPTNLTFTAVTATTITPNWVDSSTDETYFIVTRATDAAFSQNVVTAIVNSTSIGTTGTAYNLAQTGLSPVTTYYYKIQSTAEAATPSTGITGSQATLAGITYYWVGTTGGTLGTATNWNTAADGTGSARVTSDTSDILIVDGDGTTPGGATTISVDVASFSLGQFKVTSNTVCTLQSSATTTRTITLTGGTGDDFLVEAGSTLNLNHAANAVAFAFSGSGNTGLIAGTYTAGGSTSNNIVTTGGTGTVFTVSATGVITNGILGTTGCITGNAASLVFANGSNYTHSGYTTTNAYIPTATWGVSATATLTGGTTGTGVTTGSTVLGNMVYNGAMTAASSFVLFASGTPTIQGNLIVNSTNYNFGTDSGPKFRPITTGTLTINGNLVINGGYVEVATTATTGVVIVNGATTINSGGGMNLSLGTLRQRGAVLTNNGSMGGANAAAKLIFDGSVPQTIAGTGVMLNAGSFYSFTVENPAGLTITHTNQIPVLNISLISGTITNSNKLAMGTGAAVAATAQIGKAGLLTPGGAFDQSPVWNLGTGTYSLSYLGESVSRTSGFEVPPTRMVTNMTVANSNGLTLTGGNLEVGSALTMTSGIITTSAGNVLSLGTAAAAGTLTGASATAYVNGPFARTIASGNANSNYILYPVGKTAYNPVSLAPATTAVTVMKAEAFDTNTGTVDASIASLSSKRWEAPIVSGTVTNVNVRLGDAAIAALNIPVQAPSAAGIYTSAFGSTAIYAAGTPNTITSNLPLASGSYTGYLAYAVSNACSGTPAPGATTATAMTVCLGGSTTLGITTVPSGSGITYQWQSSPDGLTYTNIPLATNNTYVATPTAVTYYQCVVTCSAGPVSGTSTPVQITFTNNITGTTPVTRCGTGTVTLSATASSGTINWYDAAAGGNLVGSGPSFTTPSISGNTTYYAAAESGTPGNATIGAGTGLTGTTEQPTAFCNRWPNYWSQTIYTAAELRAAGLTAGNITSMAYNVTSLGDGATNGNFTVKIGTTAGTSFANTTFLSTAAYTTVYGPLTHTHTATGWQVISFATPYVWDGVSNIVVNVTHDGADALYNTQTYYTVTTDNKLLWVTSYNGSTTAGNASVNRLNVLFGGQVACSSPRVAVQATVTTPPALTLNTSSVAICSGTSSSAVTLTAGAADYDTYVWSPATNVTGNAGTGWVFNPSANTTYTLTASQSSGSLCSTITTVAVTVNPLPSAVSITPSSATVCEGIVQTLVATGGTNSGSGSIGTGTSSAGTTAYPNPLSSYYGGAKHQMIYTATELSALGMINGSQITKVALDINAYAAVACTNLTIRMKATSSTTLSGFEAGTTDVYGPTTFTPSATGFTTFDLTTPFAWNGTDNIIIEFVHNAGNSGNGSGTTVRYTVTPDNKTYYGASDGVAGGIAGFDALASYNVSGATVNRPNVKLDFSKTNSITWSPLTDLYTDAAGTVAYTGTNASTVYFKSSTIGTSTYTATATTANNCTSAATVGVTVNGNRTIALSSAAGTDSQTVCINTPITNITYTLGNATNATVTGLPAGVTGVYSAGLVTISGTPTASGTFNYTVTPVGCGLAVGTGTMVVNQTAQPTASAQTFCNSATVADLTATGTATQWYAGPTGGSPLAQTTALSTNTYYVTQTISGCESPRLAVSVTVNVVGAPTGSSTQTISVPVLTDATIEDLSATGSNVVWYPTAADALAGTNAIPAGTQLVNGNIYYAMQTVGSCTSNTYLAVTVTVTLGVKDFALSNLKLYPNPVVNVLNIENGEIISGIEIYSVTGQKVMVKSVNELSTSVDMSGLAGGTYLVNVASGDAVKTVKVIKK